MLRKQRHIGAFNISCCERHTRRVDRRVGIGMLSLAAHMGALVLLLLLHLMLLFCNECLAAFKVVADVHWMACADCCLPCRETVTFAGPLKQ